MDLVLWAVTKLEFTSKILNEGYYMKFITLKMGGKLFR